MNTLASRVPALAAILAILIVTLAVALTGDIITSASADLDGLMEAGRRKP